MIINHSGQFKQRATLRWLRHLASPSARSYNRRKSASEGVVGDGKEQKIKLL